MAENALIKSVMKSNLPWVSEKIKSRCPETFKKLAETISTNKLKIRGGTRRRGGQPPVQRPASEITVDCYEDILKRMENEDSPQAIVYLKAKKERESVAPLREEAEARLRTRLDGKTLIQDIFEEFGQIIGQREIKEFILQEVAKYGNPSVIQRRQPPFMNIALFGSAGTGKTVAAQMIARCFGMSGILLYDSIKEFTGKDLTGDRIGQSGKIMAENIVGALEQVVFIDEAYGIVSCIPKDGEKKFDPEGSVYGLEALTELVKITDKYRGKQVIIVAGYKKDMMGCFFKANEGLERRFPNMFELQNYDEVDLAQIFIRNLNLDVNRFAAVDVQNRQTRIDFTTFVSRMFQESEFVFKNQAGDMLNLAEMFMDRVDRYKQMKFLQVDGFQIPFSTLEKLFRSVLKRFIKLRTP